MLNPMSLLDINKGICGMWSLKRDLRSAAVLFAFSPNRGRFLGRNEQENQYALEQTQIQDSRIIGSSLGLRSMRINPGGSLARTSISVAPVT